MDDLKEQLGQIPPIEFLGLQSQVKQLEERINKLVLQVEIAISGHKNLSDRIKDNASVCNDYHIDLGGEIKALRKRLKRLERTAPTVPGDKALMEENARLCQRVNELQAEVEKSRKASNQITCLSSFLKRCAAREGDPAEVVIESINVQHDMIVELQADNARLKNAIEKAGTEQIDPAREKNLLDREAKLIENEAKLHTTEVALSIAKQRIRDLENEAERTKEQGK